MATTRLRLGQLLMDAQLLTPQALEEVLESQKTDGRRLGALLVEKGLINETQLTQILSHQLSVPWVSLLHIEFSRQLLNLVPHKVAERYCLVPIYVRHLRGQGDTLYVAMEDPTNEDALRECTSFSGLPARAMIAPPSDIRGAIRAYYGVIPSQRPPALTGASQPPGGTSQDLIDTLPQPTAMPVPPAETVAAAEAAAAEASAAEEPGTAAESAVAAEPAPAAESAVVSEPAPAEEPAAEGEPAQDAAPDENDASEPTAAPSELAEPGIAEPVAGEAAEALDPGAGSAPEQAAEPDVEVAIDFTRPVDSNAPSIETVEMDLPPPRRPQKTPTDLEPIPPSEIPRSSKRRGPKMVALTLLDGTTITLPARPKQSSNPDLLAELAAEPTPGPESGLTARDLIAALRAVSHGADATEILGNNMRWEPMFAALLSVLLRKHLIADWEFVEELKKI